MEPEGGILSQDDDIMAQLQQESLDLEVEPSFSLEESTRNVTAVAGTGTAPVAADTTDDTIDDTTDECNEGVLIQHMDIREPLSTLRNLLEQRLGVELMDYSFWLQDAQMVFPMIFFILSIFSNPNQILTTTRSFVVAGKSQKFGRSMRSGRRSRSSQCSNKTQSATYQHCRCFEASRGLRRASGECP